MPELIVVSIFGIGLTGFLIGLGLRESLNRLGYRIIGPAHDERDFPYPGPRWWVPVSLAVAWLALAFSFAHEGWPWLFLWLPFTAAGVWLSAVDLDVRRLPDKVQVWVALYFAIVGGVLIASGDGDWRTGLGGMLSCLLLFGGLHLVSAGRLGFGDVKLVGIAGWGLGLMSLGAVFAAIIVACILAIVFSLATRSRAFAFGPWIVLGSAAATTLHGLTLSGVISFTL
jgi:leader peptidase (prepilin peptidase)/N-methyltransferase